MEPGSIIFWPVNTPIPAGYLPCDGTLYAMAVYPALGAVLGNTYGGDGVTDFAVPDAKARFPFMPDTAEGAPVTGGSNSTYNGTAGGDGYVLTGASGNERDCYPRFIGFWPIIKT